MNCDRPTRPIWNDVARYRRHHLAHHAQTGTELDPDLSLAAPFPVTRASLAHVESVLETMHALGFSAERALSSLNVLVAYVVGHSAASYAVEPPDERSVDYAPLDPETFPRMSEAARHLPTHDVEREFEFGLDALLTGIAGGR